MGERSAPDDLTTWLRAVQSADPPVGASADVEARLLDEVRRLRRDRRRSHLKTGAWAAGLAAAMTLPLWHAATVSRPPSAAAGASTLRADLVTSFFPLPYSEVPMSRGRLIRLEVPLEMAKAFGVDAAPSATGPAIRGVLADVIVGDDGLARAVRFVRSRQGMARGAEREHQP